MINVVLVDEQDNPLGVMEKLEAHQKGLLHRAFSVMLYRKILGTQDSQSSQDFQNIEVLLQQRALGKYHGGGLWANTCCSHPELEESVIDGAYRRLGQEVFFNQPECLNLINLKYAQFFIYRAELDQGLIEHELDHVYIGEYPDSALYQDQLPNFNPEEINQMEWVSLKKLRADLSAQVMSSQASVDQSLSPSKKYAPWLAQVCEKLQLFMDSPGG